MLIEQRKQPRKPLSVKAFPRETGHSPRQVRKAIELGEIRTVKFAGKTLIPPSEADKINAAGGGVEEPKQPESAVHANRAVHCYTAWAGLCLIPEKFLTTGI